MPTVFDFDALFKLDAVVAIKEHELFSLLQIFLSGNLPEFKAWSSSHPQTLEKHRKCSFLRLLHPCSSCLNLLSLEISASELERKIRLLTLASLAFKYIGQNLSYSKVAEALQVDPSEVEKWVIDGTKLSPYLSSWINPFSIYSHPRWSRMGQAFADYTKPPHLSCDVSFIREGTMAGFGKATIGVESRFG